MTWNELVELVNSQLTEEQKEYSKHWVVVASDKVKEISIS